jgi:hypothetical protein
MNDFRDLDDFNDDYNNADLPDSKGEEIPDGTYNAFIERAELTRTRETNKPMLKLMFRVMDGPSRGRCAFKNTVIERDRIQYLKLDLTRMGIEAARLSELPSKHEENQDGKQRQEIC